MIKILYRYMLISLILVTFSGCASSVKLESIPVTNDEFSQPIETIRDKYSDVALFEKKEVDWGKVFTLQAPPEKPTEKELVERWGTPSHTQNNWGQWLGLTAFNISLGAATGLWVATAINQLVSIFPNETLTWEKGTTKVEAKFSSSGYFGYQSRLNFWEWSKVNSPLVIGELSD